jgi:hypothetical protein
MRKAPLVPVSWGELIDKLTILEIKAAQLHDGAALANVRKEHDALAVIAGALQAENSELAKLTENLRAVNRTLWKTEDDIRACEAAGDFGARFVALARAVYRNNDERARLKRTINELLGSELQEEKSYMPLPPAR